MTQLKYEKTKLLQLQSKYLDLGTRIRKCPERKLWFAYYGTMDNRDITIYCCEPVQTEMDQGEINTFSVMGLRHKGATNGRNKQSDTAIFSDITQSLILQYLSCLKLILSRKNYEPFIMGLCHCCHDQWICNPLQFLLLGCCRLRNK